MTALTPPASRCSRCGADPAPGWAFVNDDRYCHPDDGPSCYGAQDVHQTSISAPFAPPASSGDPQGGSGAQAGAERRCTSTWHGIRCDQDVDGDHEPMHYTDPNRRAYATWPPDLADRAPDPGGLHGADVARIVAEHWRDATLKWGDTELPGRLAAHPLCCVLAALDGETDPSELGIEPGSDAWRALTDRTGPVVLTPDQLEAEVLPLLWALAVATDLPVSDRLVAILAAERPTEEDDRG